MNLEEAKQVALRTHVAAINTNTRASAMHWISGPGIGKSDTALDYAKALGQYLNQRVGMHVFMMATIGSVDVRGFMMPFKDASGKLASQFSIPPWYPTAANSLLIEPDGTVIEEGAWEGPIPDFGVLFLDEFSQAEDDVKKPAAELVYKGHVGNTHLPTGWRVISAGNRMTDRSGVVREMMFLVNRRAAVTIDASLPAWLNWANRQPIEHRPHYLTLSFAQKNPDVVFKDAVPDGTDPFCTPRTLCLMDKDLQALRSAQDVAQSRLPLDPVAREVCASWIGKAAAAQFYTHLKYADELPDMVDIIKDPETAKLPSNKDAQMVASYMLAHNIDNTNADAVMSYLKRMHIEMQVLAVRAITAGKAAGAVLNTKGFSQWVTQHKRLLIDSRS